jgi:outer membrane protein assembly factor BamD
MKQPIAPLLYFVLVINLLGCKSGFETIRSSGNPDLIIKAAGDYYAKKEYLKAQTLYDLVMSNLKGRKEAELAYFQYAYTYYHLKQYVLSAYYFKTFANTYINSPMREEAAYMSAYSNYRQSPTYRLDQSATLSAIDEFQLFANLFPGSDKVPECNRLIDELRRKLEQKAFAEGELYFNMNQYQSAVSSFDNLLRDYPESPDVERVRYLIALSDYLLSENSVLSKKNERYEETIKRCDQFLQKYPESKYAKEVGQIQKESQSKRDALRQTTTQKKV